MEELEALGSHSIEYCMILAAVAGLKMITLSGLGVDIMTLRDTIQ